MIHVSLIYKQTNHTKLQSDIYSFNMPLTVGKDTGSSGSHCQWLLHFFNNIQVQKKIKKMSMYARGHWNFRAGRGGVNFSRRLTWLCHLTSEMTRQNL